MAPRKSSAWRKKTLQRLIERDGAACTACETGLRYRYINGGVTARNEDGRALEHYVYRVSNLHVDHICPLHLGGNNDDDNLQLLCEACHRKKTSAEQSARLRALGAGRNAR